MPRLNQNKGIGRSTALVLLLLILLVQLASLGYLGDMKGAYHIDEVYTYVLSNSHDADRISNATGLWDTWISGEELLPLVSVQEGEEFSYDTVYYNNSLDAHPPLYYYLFHTVCSLTPNLFSKWSGLLLNYSIFILAQIILYALCLEFTDDRLWALAAPAVYGGTVFAVDTAMFIRMYMLITLFTLILALIHVRIVRRGFRYGDCLLCLIITFAGVYSHYFFALAAFFLAAFMCIYLLCRKEFKHFLCYALSMLAGVALVFALYPAAFTQIGGSETNNVGKEVASNILNFSRLPAAMRAFLKEGFLTAFQGLYHCLKPAALIGLLSLAAEFIIRKKDEQVRASGKELLSFIAVFAVFVQSFVSAAHLAGKFSYLRYIYNVLPLLIIAVILAARCFFRLLHTNGRKIAIGLIAIGLLCSYTIAKNGFGSFLMPQDREIYESASAFCEDKPLVLLNTDNTAVPTYNFTALASARQLYMTVLDEDSDFDSIVSSVDVENGVAVMIATDKTWMNGFDGEEEMQKIIKSSDIFKSYEKALDMNLAEMYILK